MMLNDLLAEGNEIKNGKTKEIETNDLKTPLLYQGLDVIKVIN